MDDDAQWVKVEFYARVPDREVLVGIDVAEVGANLMRTFGFAHIDGLSVSVAEPRRHITEAEYRAALPGMMARIADDLNCMLPEKARDAGLRFEWTDANRRDEP